MKFKYTPNYKLYAAKRSMMQKLFGYCPCCNRWFKWPITVARRHTEYCDEASNYLTACDECHEEDNAYFDELWRDYNASRL